MFSLPLLLRFILFPILFLVSTFFVSAQIMDTVQVAREVDSLIQVSRNFTSKRDFAQALEMNAVAEKLALEKFGRESMAYGNFCFNQGRILHFKGLYSEAEKWYLQAKVIREKCLGNNNLDYAKILNNMAVLYRDMGRFDMSESYYIEAIPIYEQNLGTESLDYAGIISNVASLYTYTSQYEKAESLHLKAIGIRERILGRENPDFAASLNNLANLYWAIGQYEKAEPLMVEAKNIRGKVMGKNHIYYAESLYNLGLLYWKMNIYEKAESLLLESIVIRENEQGKEHPDYAKSLDNLAVLYDDMGLYEKAEILIIEAKNIREKKTGKEHPDYAWNLSNLATLYWKMGMYEKAEPLFIETKILLSKVMGKESLMYAGSLVNLANLYKDMGQIDKAEHLYVEASGVLEQTLGNEHIDFANSMNNLANLYKNMRRYQEAENLFSMVAYIYQTLQQKGMNHLSEQEMSAYLSKFLNKQYEILSFMHQAGSMKFAQVCYDNTLFYKGFILTAANQIKQLALSDSITTEKFNLLKSCQRRLSAEYAKPIAERKNIEELEEKTNDLEKDLARSVAGYGEAMRQVKWQEVQQALKPGEAAIEFVHYQYYRKKITDSIMYAALILRPGDEQPLYVPLCEARQLQSHIEVQRLMSLNNLYVWPGEGSPSLYGLLWSPLEPLLKGVNTIYYSPSGELHRLNLAAINGPSGEVTGNRYHLQLLMSTRQLVSPTPTPKLEGGTATVFGGIRYDADSTAIHAANNRLGFIARDTTGGYLSYRDRTRGDFEGKWEYLDATKEESSHISKTLEGVGITTTLLQGAEATEEAFKQIGTTGPSPKILHLATHGYFFPDPAPQSSKGGVGNEPVFKMSEHPLIRSGLILAGANHAWRTGHPYEGSEDGILTAYEVSQMNLSNTELVVLSACETGLGDIKGNEGVYGLQRAFRIAGARYLLMSLWKVPDGPTSELMAAFYSYWLKDKMPLEDAFKRAQAEMKAQYEDPEMWAGFVLIKG